MIKTTVIQKVLVLASVLSIAVGLWMIHPSACLIGVGVLVLADLVHGLGRGKAK